MLQAASRMKLLHAADLHLDSALTGLERYEGAPVHKIRGATRAAFENLTALALEEGVSLVLFAGDIYDDDWKDYSTALFFRKELVKLAQAGVRVVWLRGNHDAASQLQKYLDLPERVHELPHRRPGSLTFEDLGVVVHGQGFATRAVTENLAASYPEPLPGLLNVGLLHTSLTGREGHEPYAPCALSELVNKGYDYWALGHVHQREVVSRDPWVVFPGNLQGRHVREPGAKGATLIEVSDRRITGVEHRALDVVRFTTCAVDASRAGNTDEVLAAVRDALSAALAGAEGRLLAARVIVSGATRAHAALSRDEARVVAQIHADASELGGDELWLEKVRLSTRDVAGTAELAARDDAIGQVFRGIAALRGSPEAREELLGELAMLGAKLPPALRSGPSAVGWADGTELDALLDDVEQLLLPRLSGADET